MRVGEARTPEGMRLYAIGDVHGCDDLLAEAHRTIADDLGARPIGGHRIIHIGDYGDRGPETAAVIERLAGLTINDPSLVCLRGNHDEMLLGFLEEPDDMGATFIANGGEATLASYGVEVGLLAMFIGDHADLARRLAGSMPAHHRAFLEALELTARFGDYFFCHAGIRPGVPLDRRTISSGSATSSCSAVSTTASSWSTATLRRPSPRSCPTASMSTPARCSRDASPAWCSRGRTTGSSRFVDRLAWQRSGAVRPHRIFSTIRHISHAAAARCGYTASAPSSRPARSSWRPRWRPSRQ
jgi:Calcineurin-like phosphoesterase